MRKLVSGCQGVPCLAGLYQQGGTMYSLGFHCWGCDYADLSEVKQNRTFPSLCCLRKHKRVAANNIEYYSCYLQLRAVLRTRLDELTEPVSHTAYSCPKGQFCPL